MVAGIPISFVNPNTGELLDQPVIVLFYASIIGIAVIILYSSYKEKKERQKSNARRRSRK